MKDFEISQNIVKPEEINQNNYTFDTTAYNNIARKMEYLDILEKSLHLGYCYYKTSMQDRELYGFRINKTNDGYIDKHESVIAWEESFNTINERLKVQNIAYMATFNYKGWRLDGSCYMPVENSKVTALYNNIFNNNIKHYDDAIIAASGILNSCIVVVNYALDKRMYDEIKKNFPNNVIKLDDLIKKINMELIN